MKKIVTYVVCILMSALFIGAMPLSGEEKLYDNVIRLHILANSDSEEDQNLKLKIRDEILLKYGERLKETENIESASKEVELLLNDIKNTAKEIITSEGYDYSVETVFGREYYPKRQYNDIYFPAGNYISLRVVIGEGKGKNWWCVLFPPICLSGAYGDSVEIDDSVPVGLTPEQYKIISNSKDVKYVLKFKMLEILESVFHN